MINDEPHCLRLIDPRIAEAIRRGTGLQRRVFAIRCAARALLELATPEGDAAARTLFDVLAREAALDSPELQDSLEVLRHVEDELQQQLLLMRNRDDGVVPYARYVETANIWHAVRAQRFALTPDAATAAGMAAFECSFLLGDAAPLVLLAAEILTG
jgi:hypothetical protein